MKRVGVLSSIAAMSLLTMSLLAACGGKAPSTTPCTECLGVAGTWEESSTETTVSCQDGSTLTWDGGTRTFVLAQTDSALTVTAGTLELTGTLHDDHSVAFDPVRAVARGQSGAPDAPGTLAFVGEFEPTTPPKFTGTYTFVKDSDRTCTLTVVVGWTKK
jgi:hypothetical protein